MTCTRRRAAYVRGCARRCGAAAAVNSSAKAPAGGPVRGGTLTKARIADIFTMDRGTVRSTTLDLHGPPDLRPAWSSSRRAARASSRRAGDELEDQQGRAHGGLHAPGGVKFSDGSPADRGRRRRPPSTVSANPKEPCGRPDLAVKAARARTSKVRFDDGRAVRAAPPRSLDVRLSASLLEEKQFDTLGRASARTRSGRGRSCSTRWQKGSSCDLVPQPELLGRRQALPRQARLPVVGRRQTRACFQLESGTVDVIDSVREPGQLDQVAQT